MRDFFGRHMIMIGFCAVAAYSAYLYKSMWSDEKAERNTQSFNYEMPRPKAYYGDMDLSGRKVSRKSIRPEGDNPVANAAIAPKAEPPKVNAQAAAANKAQKDKDKKKKAVAAKNKKSAVRVAVVGDASGMGLSKSGLGTSNNYTAPGVNALAPQTATNNETKTEENKLSAAQWRSLLFAQPNAKNTNEFIAAFKKGHVDSTSFYQISHDLLKDTATDRQTAALYIFKNDSSVKGFEVLVAEHEQQNDPLKGQIYDVLKTYSQQSKMNVLARVLYHSDTEVVKVATDLLTIAVQAQQNQGQNNNGQPATPAISVSTFNQFLPALRRLSLQDDATLAAVAQQLLSSIQAMSQA